MISYTTYKVLHFLGIFLVLVSLAGVTVHAMNGGTRATNAGRRMLLAMHGVGALIILVAGFGLVARIGIMHGTAFPMWVWGKVAVWMLLGAAIALPYRRPEWTRVLLIAIPLLALTAAGLALYKP